MASGTTTSISGTAMGVQIRFSYSTSYHAATNTSTVTLTPYLYTTVATGGSRGYNGAVYGNGSSIFNLGAGYNQGDNLYAQNTNNSWESFTPVSGSLSTFTISHNNSGNASFTAGYSGRVRAASDGTTASVSNATGCTASVHENRSLYVSYDANEGSGAPNKTYFYGSTESITLSSTVPTRTGYTFLGWGTSSSATTATYSPGQNIGTRSSNLALFAVWKVNSYNVTLTAGDFIDSVSGAGTYEYMSSVTVSAVLGSATGYTYAFDGWYITGGALIGSSNPFTFIMPDHDRALTAKAKRTANPYTVHFDANGGTGTMSDESFTYDQAQALTANSFTRTGYTFLGWSTNSSAVTPTYSDEQSVSNLAPSGTVTLYAVWSLDTYTLTLTSSHTTISVNRDSSPIGGGATGTITAADPLYYNDVITVTFTVDTGYTLSSAQLNGADFVSGDSFTVTANVAAAVSATANTYTVVYNANRPTGYGGGTMANQSFTYDTAQNLTANAFTRYFTATFDANGGTVATATNDVYCTFKGWGLSTVDQVQFTDQQSVSNLTTVANGTVNLYAKWQYGMVTLPSATRAGFTFKGWYNAPTGGEKVGNAGNSFQLSVNATYYAQWQALEYPLSVTQSDNGCVVNVYRQASPYGGGSVGYLSNGSTLYFGDTVLISYSINGGYEKKQTTLNGVDFGGEHSGSTSVAAVSAAVAVVILVKLGAIVYINNVAYQAFIDTGSVIEGRQYEAFIDNGTSWEAF